MVIGSTPSPFSASRAGGPAAPTAAQVEEPQDTSQLSPAALASAAAPASPLSTIPTDWFPMGQQSRQYGAYLGGVPIPRTSGTAQVNRSDDQISLSSPQGNFSMAQDPDNPGRVVVNTPQGDYHGTLHSGPMGEVTFDAGDNRTVTMNRVVPRFFGSPYIEVSASGFGLPVGSLRVF